MELQSKRIQQMGGQGGATRQRGRRGLNQRVKVQGQLNDTEPLEDDEERGNIALGA